MAVIYVDDKDNLPEREENDFYPTPTPVVRKAILHTLPEILVKLDSKLMVLDPGAGTGVWGEELLKVFLDKTIELHGVDIDQNHPVNELYNKWIVGDFLDFTTETRYDLIIGNPPFKFAKGFVNKSLDLLKPGGFLYLLFDIGFLTSQQRYDDYFVNPLSGFKKSIIFSSRVSFKGSNNPNLSAMFLWEKGYTGPRYIEWIRDFK